MVFYLGLIWPGRPDGLDPRVFGANYFSNNLKTLNFKKKKAFKKLEGMARATPRGQLLF